MPARILPPTPENIALAAEVLLRGEVVGMPTETVYGLAGLALDEAALTRIFSTKDRPTFDPLIVHVATPTDGTVPQNFDWIAYLESLRLVDASCLSAEAKRQVESLAGLWPGPLTLVLPKLRSVPDLATAGLSTVGIRVPAHPVAQTLLRAVGQSLAAPSANRFGRLSPTGAVDVAAELGGRIDIILDGGACEIGVESTVVQVDPAADQVILLRPGFYTREFLEGERHLRLAMPQPSDTSNPAAPQSSPGMLASHYAPAKPLYMLPAAYEDLSPEQREKIASVLAGSVRFAFLSLSELGDSAKAARNLFRSLRELDADPEVDVILAEPVPDETGLWHAIADRLRRASQPWE